VSNYTPCAKLLWSLAASGTGTTISGSGNSGGWEGNGPGDILPQADFEGSIRLRDVLDVGLYVSVGAVTGSPAFQVQLDVFDSLGNLYAQLIKTASLSAAGSAAPVFGGLHGAGASAYLVLPEWGRLSWTCTGGSVTGTEIELWGR
jgi:hypothetical protein